MADNIKRRKNKGQKKNGSDTGLAVSVTSTVLAVLTVAAFCTSSSKGSAKTSSPPVVYDTQNNVVVEETNGGFFWSEETERQTESETRADIPEDTVIGDETSSEPPPEKPDEGEREYYDDERFIGGYKNNGVSVEISKVERGELNYFICDIKLSSPSQLQTAFAAGRIKGRLFTSQIASSVGAAFAVNGDFCGFRTEGIIIREGTLYRNNKKSGWDLLCLDKNGDLITCDNDTADGNTLVNNGVLQTWCFGPTLVKNGAVVNDFNTPNLSRSAKEPRTAIGQLGRLHYIILVVDAVRTQTSTEGGMSFSQLAEEFVSLGCTTAYNLDGGGSTTLYFNGKVINDPCVRGERQISDIIYLK